MHLLLEVLLLLLLQVLLLLHVLLLLLLVARRGGLQRVMRSTTSVLREGLWHSISIDMVAGGVGEGLLLLVLWHAAPVSRGSSSLSCPAF